MNGPRAPMTPPRFEGYEHVRLLGSGGYSDVFLYEQQMPRRLVAIKVLVAHGVSDLERRQFVDEANTMAAVSTHPYIVTIFHAGVSPDGHPHLVMEFYPQPNYSVRARTEKIPVAEVLRTGIQVASAVETAHRAGILHRDIKPANILTSDYGRPGLTDFGIATSAGDNEDAAGMSIPWSPPEVTGGSGRSDVTADVYSLGATLYTMLAGRSPFEVSGGRNGTLDLLERIERGDPPPTGRPDSPASLERLLRQSMAKQPGDRPSSAAELARALQAIEVEQQLAVTPFEVRDDRQHVRPRVEEDDTDGTRLKAPVVIHSQDAPVARGVPPTAPATVPTVGAPPPFTGTGPGLGVPDGTVPAGGSAVDGSTVQRAPGTAGMISGIGARPAYGGGRGAVAPMPDGAGRPIDGPAPTPIPVVEQRLRRTPAELVRLGAAVVVALVAVLVVVLVATADGKPGGGTPSTTEPASDDPLGAPQASSLELKDADNGASTLTFELDDLPEGASISVEDAAGVAPSTPLAIDQRSVTIPADGPQCVIVVVVAADGQTSDSEPTCR